jgi:hypothetical protein
MNDRNRTEITKELIKAQDALRYAFDVACRAGDLDLANDLRKRRIALGDAVARINGGPVRISARELTLQT